jgi:hypothetical protein
MARRWLKSVQIGSFGLASALLTPCSAFAAPLAPPLSVPAITPPQINTAALYALQLRLPEGRGLARLLLQAGVNRDDASAVARLAAGHLGDGLGGCEAKVELSRSIDGRSFRLERVELLTQAAQTVIERRHGELTIASEQGTARSARLV